MAEDDSLLLVKVKNKQKALQLSSNPIHLIVPFVHGVKSYMQEHSRSHQTNFPKSAQHAAVLFLSVFQKRLKNFRERFFSHYCITHGMIMKNNEENV